MWKDNWRLKKFFQLQFGFLNWIDGDVTLNWTIFIKSLDHRSSFILCFIIRVNKVFLDFKKLAFVDSLRALLVHSLITVIEQIGKLIFKLVIFSSFKFFHFTDFSCKLFFSKGTLKYFPHNLSFRSCLNPNINLYFHIAIRFPNQI